MTVDKDNVEYFTHGNLRKPPTFWLKDSWHLANKEKNLNIKCVCGERFWRLENWGPHDLAEGYLKNNIKIHHLLCNGCGQEVPEMQNMYIGKFIVF